MVLGVVLAQRLQSCVDPFRRQAKVYVLVRSVSYASRVSAAMIL